ncbi:PASTA domain-containing protein [Leptothrix cholodnii]|nr:PASTA domain-containing protein [Leptothrix cholodnii]
MVDDRRREKPMAHDVLISYSSHDRLEADAICNRLESQGIRCWIAPRDVPPGSEYADSIVQAIESARVMVLVYSAHADGSKQVRREVERAVSIGRTIMPVRIQNAEMSKAFKYYVGSIHWLDAITPPLEQHIDRLGRDIQAVLSAQPAAPGPAAATTTLGLPRTARPDPAPAAEASGTSRKGLMIGGGVAVTVALLAGGYFLGQATRDDPLVAAPTAAGPPVASPAVSQAVSEAVVAPATWVPSVNDRSRREASELLEAAGLKVKLVEQEHAELRFPKVIGTDPAAGQAVPADREVTLYVSGMRLLPSVLDLPIEKAKSTIQDAGFSAPVEIRETASPKPEGVVIGMQPPGGSRHFSSKPVVLEVSAPKALLADLVKRPVAEAEQALKEARFNPQVVRDWIPGAAVGTVAEMKPAAGSRLNPGDTVTLRVAAAGGWVYHAAGRQLKGGQTFRMDTAGNLRTEPRSGSKTLDVLSRGQMARVLEAYGDGWLKVVVLD